MADYKKVILKNGETRFIIDVDLGVDITGKRKRTKVRGKTLKEAKRKKKDLIAGKMSIKNNDAPTFEQAWRLYIADQTKRGALSPMTVRTKASQYKSMEPFYNVKIDKITSIMIEEWANTLTGANKTVNEKCVALNTFLKWLVKKNFLKENPYNLELLKGERKEMCYLTEDEFEKVYRFIDERFKLATVTLMYTGLRKEELCGLQATDIIDHELHLSHTRQGTELTTRFKNKQSKRIVPIPSWLEKELVAAFRHKRLIFWHCYTNTFVKELKIACCLANINKNITPHSLRHSYVSLMINEGKTLWDIAQLVGHGSILTTERVYGHMYSEHRKKLVETLEVREWRQNGDIFDKKAVN